jgi:formate hydrogenlyase subunit 3/multisubunit Na+/H+ antiporter MnhD subunit
MFGETVAHSMTDPNQPASRDKDNGTDNAKKQEDEGPLPTENLFKLMDGVINQLNVTKRMFLIMILSIMILPPLALVISFAIADAVTEGHPWFFLHRDPWVFGIARNLPLIISVVWLGVGIRQWFVLSSWAKRYQRYKDRQREAERKLTDEGSDMQPTNE